MFNLTLLISKMKTVLKIPNANINAYVYGCLKLLSTDLEEC